MEKKERTVRAPSTAQAIILLLAVIVILMLSVTVLDLNIQIALFVCIIIVACFTIFLGYKWEDIQQMMMDGVMSMLIATFILLLIGTVIAAWIASGTIPYIIYLGLKLISPKFFLLCACLAAAFMSMACGSSWSSAGTVGIAFMGIGAGLGINPAMTAGAIVSGAYFGDKQSPFSDTTNLASALSGTSLFDHISSMLWTTTPSLIISLILYTVLGFMTTTSDNANTETANMYIEHLSENFNLSPVLLLPILILIFVIVKKSPAIPGLVISALVGGLFAVVFQHESIIDVANFMFDGYTIDTGVEQINKLLNRGGLSSMLWTVSFYFMACILGNILDVIGVLKVVLSKLAAVTKSVRTLIPSTLVSSFALCAFTGSLESSMLMTSKLFAPAYDELNLDRKVLSRSLEDAGTMLAALIPWNSNGVFMATTLGVATISYLPYAFLGLFTPIFSIICACTGIGIFYKTKNGKKDGEPI